MISSRWIRHPSPIPTIPTSNKILEAKGTRKIQACASTMDTNCVTLVATNTASGKMLSLFTIFKGAPNGCIASREFSTYPADGKYACQRKAWMDGDQIHALIDAILKPYKDENDESNPDGPPPIHILKTYCVHQMGLVVNHIQLMGIEVLHLPAGCTYLCQPIDMGISSH